MKLWLIVRTDDVDYDEARSLVVAAETKDDALQETLSNVAGVQNGGVWFRPTTHVEDIGDAHAEVPAGIVLVSMRES